MLLSIFKPNQPILNFFAPLIVLIFWLPAFWNPPLFLPLHPMPLYSILYVGLMHLPNYLIRTLTVILLSFQAIHFNYIINHHEVLFRKTNIPLIMYILFSSLLPEMQVMGPVMI